MSVNKAILLGYVGNDPEIRYPEPDKPVATVSLATNETGKNGVELTEWHRLVFWGETARIVERYVRKGTRLYVEGKLTTREYQDRLKITRQRTEILVSNFEILGRRNEN
ncbi:MAG: single-stranded DNA-binding protein [Muribaculaceae bacterium]|nr:single-stranded DNA-binding protein [Muribaculaceae bacterium]